MTPTTNLAISRFRGIGTAIELITHAATQTAADALLARAQRVADQRIAELDKAASRFRTDSELTGLQAVNSGEWAPTSTTLARALHAALWAAQWSDGLVDPTVGAALRTLGYSESIEQVRERTAPLAITAPVPGQRWSEIGLRLNDRMVRIPRGVSIDLGATGKSWLAATVAAEIHRVTGGGILVNMGGDIAVAGTAPRGGWLVSIADGRGGGLVAIHHGAIATSSTKLRTWDTVSDSGTAQRKHHIVDPRTGDSAPDVWETVTVVADSCLTANVATTASIVLGSAAPAWLAARGLHARLVSHTGDIVYVGEWPDSTDSAGQRQVAQGVSHV